MKEAAPNREVVLGSNRKGDLPTAPGQPAVVGWRRDVENAPRTGEPFIAMARFPQATAGFPQFAVWQDGQFMALARRSTEPLVVWAWMSRDVLGDWPSEFAEPAYTPTTVRSYSMPRDLPMPKYEFQNPPFGSASSFRTTPASSVGTDDRNAGGSETQ